MNLFDAGAENPPWSAVEGAESGGATVVRSMGGIAAAGWHPVPKFPGTEDQVRWRQLLVPSSLRAPLLQHLHVGLTAAHMGVKETQDRVIKMAY